MNQTKHHSASYIMYATMLKAFEKVSYLLPTVWTNGIKKTLEAKSLAASFSYTCMFFSFPFEANYSALEDDYGSYILVARWIF